MRTFNSIDELPTRLTTRLRGAAYAIGNFDGVHLGHQAVIRASTAAAARLGAPAAVMSFEPPPSAFFHPQKKQYRLTLIETKTHLISQMKVDFLLNLKFDAALAQLPPHDFISGILHDRLGARYVAVGENFHFGRKREGNAAFLQREAPFEVDVLPSVTQEQAVVSSTHIRAALQNGEPQKAAHLLGRWFQIDGKVCHGQKRGRTLGFPTLNIALEHYTRIAYGVYAVRCFVKQQWFDGVANIGLRPTLGDLQEPLLEVYLFNTDGDFYDEQANVFLLDFLRAEEKFSSLDALKAQMKKDSAQARACLPSLAKKPYLFGKIE